MKELQELAAKLLTDGAVKVVIGYEEGPLGVRAAFITNPADTSKLVFDARCVQNLTSYLKPQRNQIWRLGKPAVVVKGCDNRSLAGLIREQQIARDAVTIIAVRCGGVLTSSEKLVELTEQTTASRCAGCDIREPKLYDYIVGELPPAPPVNPARAEMIAKLAAMTQAERRAFWDEQFSRCVRCYACRQACPMCYCKQCMAYQGQPQWIKPSPTPEGNEAWQIMRVLHQAGRCADCLECERACPESIPLGLLTRYVFDSVEQRFHTKASDDPAVPAPLGAYRTDDEEEFIR